MSFVLRFVQPVTAMLCLLSAYSASADDVVEFLSGSKVFGKIKAIRKEAKEFDFEAKIGTQTYTRTYPYSKVHAVTINGKRFVLTEKTAASTGTSRGSSSGSGTSNRSKNEIERLIQDVGGSPPEWYDATPLDYPGSLDLSWPIKPPDNGWNNQKNMGQYIWDIINPNPGRWRSGVKLIHHVMTLHKDDSELLVRDMQSLAGMYFKLFQDYPRAAFWIQKAGVEKGTTQSVMLAECYWRMGSKSMALEVLNSRTLPATAIKLLGDMGETSRALQLVEAYARAGRPHEAYLLGGDACRLAGQFPQAISFYQKVLDAEGARNKDYEQRFKARARESMEAVRLFDQADVRKVADGSYRSSSTGYNGALEVEVKVAGAKIQSVTVTRHSEKQFYAALTDTPNQIISRQSVKGVDATSGATITAQAIVNATAKALAQGAR